MVSYACLRYVGLPGVCVGCRVILADDEVAYPDSYQHNSFREKSVIECVDNFRRQYIYIYPDRKPLLLMPLNECGVEVN